MRTTTTLLIGIAALVLTAGGCAFDRQYNVAKAQSQPEHDITGVWQGRWVSEATGHSGKLRCIVTPLPDEDGSLTPEGKRRYKAWFHATWAAVLSGTYHIELIAEPKADTVHFAGSADLGWLAGGVYETEGQATGERWESTYRSKHDHGRFEMTRPEP